MGLLGLEARVAVLKIGTTWPLPEAFILEHLRNSQDVLFIEEVDPVLENNVKGLYADYNGELPRIRFLGKKSGTVPAVGELSPGLVIDILAKVTGVSVPQIDACYEASAAGTLQQFAPSRSLAFCPGCPHRASFWAMKTALALDGRDGVVFGDIGCYSLSVLAAGFHQSKTLHAMGSGTGLASGFGVLNRLGAIQPSIAVCGDSTFYHAAIPALINALHHQSNFLLIILDNSATAMTGFQPHPGSPSNAMGFDAPRIVMEDLCRSLGLKTVIQDPFDIEDTVQILYELLQENRAKVLILRQECALVRGKKASRRYNVRVDPEKCLGEDCGCNRLCTRVFRCPGLRWDVAQNKSGIDEAVCTGCGVCADICRPGAIIKEKPE